jgi:hypothetical protein
MILRALACAALLFAPASDRMVWPVADGFVVVHSQHTQRGDIEERVPSGETVDNWTRMITLVTLPDPIDPMRYAQAMAKMWGDACPDAQAGAPVRSERGVDIRIDCPINPRTGKPETMFQRTVAGDGKLYVLQIAFRSPPDAAQASWAMAQLDAATLCDDESDAPACA